ncbi:MaoC/PaaZ C-terminal domain-containing protein [Dactylosporangium sp. NPDC051484]|uniref:MaoC/PaaZ C-terminal domain-containing protein n=1 Tax=Dactylosporangium sp. NPDC051484 TaxID=3154942 RepID=UPI00344F4F5A
MNTIVLERPPRLGPLYCAAALRRSTGTTLPERGLRLDGVRVDLAHLAEYDRVCGFRLGDELPATYPHVLAFPLAMALMTAPDFPFPLLGLVHVRNRVEMLRPLRSSDTFSLSVCAEALRPHERGTQLDVVATAAIDSEVVWTDRSTYLHKTSKSRKSEKSQTLEVPDATWCVPRRTGSDYARVSGDRNPIHTSRILARAFGFPATIAHGMWTKARCLAALEGRLPDAYAVEVAFKLPILLPATVGFSASPDRTGWRFAVHDPRTGRPHLAGAIVDPGCAEPGAGGAAGLLRGRDR